MFLFCLVFAMSLCASVYMCFVVTCWERANLLALICGVCCMCHFPIGILGQVWYLIVLIPDLCTLTFFTYKSAKCQKMVFLRKSVIWVAPNLAIRLGGINIVMLGIRP